MDVEEAACLWLLHRRQERDGYKFEDTLFEAPMADLTEGNATRGSVSANQARDMYADYFVTEGRCAWQDKMI